MKNVVKFLTIFAIIVISVIIIKKDDELIVCIDAGHGGIDAGAVNKTRYEKDDNLKISKLVRDYLQEQGIKTVMTRDNGTCQCCKRGGMQYTGILDYHHILPVFLGGADTTENGIMLCVACHRLVHLYSTDDLPLDKALLEGSYSDLTEEQKARFENEEIFEDEKRRFKRIIKLGSVIRKGIVAKGLNKEQYKKEHSNTGIGRRKPGVNAEQEMT